MMIELEGIYGNYVGPLIDEREEAVVLFKDFMMNYPLLAGKGTPYTTTYVHSWSKEIMTKIYNEMAAYFDVLMTFILGDRCDYDLYLELSKHLRSCAGYVADAYVMCDSVDLPFQKCTDMFVDEFLTKQADKLKKEYLYNIEGSV